MDAAIGIDVGSSSLKVSLVGENGTLLATAERPYAPACPRPGWKEIDPELWWSAARDAVRELVHTIAGVRVRALGVTGQMHTTVFVDEHGKSVRPAIMWNDVRTAPAVAAARADFADMGLEGNARIVSSGSPALNLSWLRDEEPRSFERLSTFLIGPDWIVFKLTGTLGTDYCEASTSSLFDFETNSWSQSAIAWCGLTEGQLPPIRGAAQVAGTLLPQVADDLGLAPDVVVVAGTGDNPAAALPTGCITKGEPVLSLGTSCVLMFSRPAPDFDACGKNIVFSIDGDTRQTLVQGVVQSCGSSRTWWDLSIMRYSGHNASDDDIDPARLGSNPVLFCPHLTGEKTIYADASLRGAFIGLSTDTKRGDLNLALMEGVAFGVRELVCRMGLRLDSTHGLQVIGGGSKSDVWMRVLANVLNVPVLRMEGAASAGYGAALLGLSATGEVSLAEACEHAVRVRDIFEPETKLVERYSAGFKRYLRVHDALAYIDEKGPLTSTDELEAPSDARAS